MIKVSFQGFSTLNSFIFLCVCSLKPPQTLDYLVDFFLGFYRDKSAITHTVHTKVGSYREIIHQGTRQRNFPRLEFGIVSTSFFTYVFLNTRRWSLKWGTHSACTLLSISQLLCYFSLLARRELSKEHEECTWKASDAASAWAPSLSSPACGIYTCSVGSGHTKQIQEVTTEDY